LQYIFCIPYIIEYSLILYYILRECEIDYSCEARLDICLKLKVFYFFRRTFMDRDLPQNGEIWRHFKDKLYKIVAIAQHTETDEKLVVYKWLIR